MSCRPRGCLWRASMLGVVLYTVFLITTPFEHHDLVCHIKTRFHCTSCTSSHLGSDPHAPAVFDGSHRADAGRAVTTAALLVGILLPADSNGRSPPA